MKNIWIIGIGFISIIAIGYLFYLWNSAPGPYDDFAKCLTENGVVMYGTDWCGACKDQKALFEKSFNYINYRNCDKYKLECDRAGVGGYPTWRINDTNYSGLQSLERLASMTGCSLE